ncbi:hypothetical protein BBO99_00002980 [Phytophthora kernoviae]|uniref:transketolase n=1 Tax=Phytophthora kernoviae TaxID=325452 RepID=A0A421EUP4_9STRA|nr:hypothetical protein BBI17_003102 [Phytophthora kernoviae]RLN82361.1 hypothetical protein BBO99_00002980 [Phytophthora kernoviae]
MADHVDKKPRIGEELCINTIRMLSADQPSAGKSGHPGAPMGCAPMAHVLFGKTMKFNPKNPKWSNRDRFVLSNGHACALQYSMLHLTGYDLPLDELKTFRQWGSKAPGHPENFATPGVEVSTGPLGQGISNAVGLAIAEKHLAAEFNKDGLNIVDHYTYVICGDGCLQEGVSSESSSLAGHLGLGKLIVLYDDNKITIDGSTDISFTEDVQKRYEAYGWDVQIVEDGNFDHAAIQKAVDAAKAVTDKPSLIKIHTTIGLGSKLENTHSVHGAPLKPDDLAATKEKFGLKGTESFYIPEQVKKFYDKTVSGAELENQWNDLFAKYTADHPKEAAEYTRRMEGKLPADWSKNMPKYTPADAGKATRQYSEIALNAVATALPEIVGGSADLTPSNLTHLSMSGDFQKDTPIGRYIRFGVREHGMASISNGLFAHGGVRPFCATFYNFIGYAMGAVRVSALSRFGVIYIATHDSIFLGEDGPTHQPIEMNAALRAMPNMYVYRPADGNETVGSYIAAIENQHKTSVLALTRQGLPNLAHSTAEAVAKGAYIVANLANGAEVEELEGEPDLVLIASGSEVSLSIEAAKLLTSYKVRVVSVPCRDLFDEQSLEYKKEVIGEGIPTMSVEAAATFGWSDYSHTQFGLDRFGASATIAQLKEHFGFNPNTVADEARKLVKFYDGRSAPSIFDRPASHLKIRPKARKKFKKSSDPTSRRELKRSIEKKFRLRYTSLQLAYEQRLEVLAARVQDAVNQVHEDASIHCLQDNALTSEYASARLGEVVHECFYGERERYIKAMSDQIAWQASDLRESQQKLRVVQKKETDALRQWKLAQRDVQALHHQLDVRVQEIQDQKKREVEYKVRLRAVIEEREAARREIKVLKPNVQALEVLQQEQIALKLRIQSDGEKGQVAHDELSQRVKRLQETTSKLELEKQASQQEAIHLKHLLSLSESKNREVMQALQQLQGENYPSKLARLDAELAHQQQMAALAEKDHEDLKKRYEEFGVQVEQYMSEQTQERAALITKGGEQVKQLQDQLEAVGRQAQDALKAKQTEATRVMDQLKFRQEAFAKAEKKIAALEERGAALEAQQVDAKLRHEKQVGNFEKEIVQWRHALEKEQEKVANLQTALTETKERMNTANRRQSGKLPEKAQREQESSDGSIPLAQHAAELQAKEAQSALRAEERVQKLMQEFQERKESEFRAAMVNVRKGIQKLELSLEESKAEKKRAEEQLLSERQAFVGLKHEFEESKDAKRTVLQRLEEANENLGKLRTVTRVKLQL